MKVRRIAVVRGLTVFLMLATASLAHARGAYMGLQAGSNMMEDITVSTVNSSYKTGFSLVGAGGYDFGSFRVEGELGYRQNDLDRAVGITSNSGSGDVSVVSVMLNAYYDFRNSSQFTPYLGGGLGTAHVSFNDVNAPGVLRVDGDDICVAFQIGAGVEYKLSRQFSVDLAYRLFVTSDIEFTNQSGTVSEDNYLANTVMAGIRYNF